MMSKWTVILLGCTIFGGLLVHLVYAALTNPERLDEYMFYRTTVGLPRYEAKEEWLREGRPDLVIEPSSPFLVYELALEKPLWIHPPLASILVYPFTRVTGNIQYLRLLPVVLTVLSLVLVFLVLRGRLGTFFALLAVSPVLLFGKVVAEAGTFFYHEVFMLFFLVLTIFLSERGSRWKYASGAALVLTKLPAVLLLVPLMVKDRTWRYGVFGLVALVPYWIATWVVGGSPWYLLDHWISISAVARWHWANFVAPNLLGHIMDSRMLIFLVIAVPGLYFATKARQYWLVVLVVLTVVLGIGWSWIYYQMIEMVFIGLFAFSYLVERLGRKVPVVVVQQSAKEPV